MRYLITTIIIALFAIIVIFTSGCSDSTTVEKKDTDDKIDGQRISIMRFQGCQYMYVSWGNATWGSHMGNCDNPIHKQNK